MHHMTLFVTHPTGAQEWTCSCGRHLVIQYMPYKMIVLAEGDTAAMHSGGAAMPGVELPIDAQAGPETHDPRLDVFDNFVHDLEDRENDIPYDL